MPPPGPAANDKRQSRTYDPVQTNKRLVAAAIELFGRQGFHATSVREIVDGAGMTKGAFYHHFDSKEDLLHTIHDQFIDFHLEGQQMILDGAGTAHERLYHLVRLLVLVVAEYHEHVSVYFQEHRALGGRFADVHAKRTTARRGFYDTIAGGIENGEFRDDVEPRVAALGILGMGNWMYQWYPMPKGPSPDEVGRTYALMALRSLTAKPQLVKRLTNARTASADPVLQLLAARRSMDAT
jgi:AcrR family transcriptional regulator